MKAIKTYYIPCNNTRPARIVATTGEKGQRVFLSYDDGLNSERNHALAARTLCNRMQERGGGSAWGWQLIGGGFPDGSMVWVFHSNDLVA